MNDFIPPEKERCALDYSYFSISTDLCLDPPLLRLPMILTVAVLTLARSATARNWRMNASGLLIVL